MSMPEGDGSALVGINEHCKMLLRATAFLTAKAAGMIRYTLTITSWKSGAEVREAFARFKGTVTGEALYVLHMISDVKIRILGR
jgi:hypothetical protein